VKVSQVRFSRREFLAGAAALAAVSALPAAALALEGSRPNYVILVDCDGFDPDYLGRAPTPNLDALASRGSFSVANGTFHTFSNPSRASMATGAYPEVHGNAAYFLNDSTNKAVGQNRFLAAETINQALADAGNTTASVQWYMVQNHGTAYGNPQHLYVQPGGPFAKRVDVAIDILNLRPVNSGGQMLTVPKRPDFMAVYGSDLDDLGHKEGAESPNIGPLLAELDRQLGRLIQATIDVGIYEETAWLVTSDHGMTTCSLTLLAEVYAVITGAGYKPEFVTPGNSPRDTTEVIIVPNGVRLGDFTLRGRAATSKGRERVQAVLEDLPQIAQVFDKSDLAVLRASDKLGDLVAEARVPWGFGLSEGGVDGAHGSLLEIKVPLVLAGAGIRAGIPPQSAALVDIAPTIAALLGTRPPADAQGRALTESLSAL
jgi:arylsulfatase A-like enzyme